MAVFNAGYDGLSVKHFGRWRSAAVERYTHIGGRLSSRMAVGMVAKPALKRNEGEFFICGSGATSDEAFDRRRDTLVFDNLDKDHKHGTLVLECFSHEVTLDDGKKTDCCGLILATRNSFWNVLKAYEGQNADGVVGVTDGTYRLHFGETFSFYE
ncbi:hypothetical protein L916_02832 [Phytophthora nicotianae]|uniref:Uncharacterized protein n=1 Tax=Phytophthora nicotianae TaxID=4792 RepID=W2JLY2_PHYNI|nr:hypothetical protein L916_02832 [Phytophthora nicotianae]